MQKYTGDIETNKELLKNYINKVIGNSENEKKIVERINSILIYEKQMNKNKKLFTEKTLYINRPIKFGEYIIYINTITENNSMFPYILVYPKALKENSELVVDTLNTRSGHNTEDRFDVLLRGLDEVGLVIKCKINVPMAYVFVPRREFSTEPYYQQLSRECFVSDNIKYNRCDLLVKASIINAQNKIQNISGKNISDKIVLEGYSTSGVFAQRFALLHPEMISKAIIGGAIGSIPIPTQDFNYPIGIKDFKQIFGEDFNEEAYKNIQFAYYAGELEEKTKSTRKDENGNQLPMHDMSYLKKSIPEDIAKEYREVFGINLNDRFRNVIDWYKKNDYKIISKIYKDANHTDLRSSKYKYIKNHFEDLMSFYTDGINGNGFKADKSSSEKIEIFNNKKAGYEDCINDKNLRISIEQEANKKIKQNIIENNNILEQNEQQK